MEVLVTRPVAEGRRTAQALAELGHRAVLAPVLLVEPTGLPPPPGPFDAVILTSANAATALDGAARALPVFAVGARTAAAARAAGSGPVVAAEGDAAALAGLVADRLAPTARLLHPAGRDRKAEPAASLQARGFQVETWEVYGARSAAALPEPARDALAAGRIGAVLHYSRRSAALLLDLARREGVSGALGGVRHLCLSADVAKPLQAAGLARVETAAGPRESDLLTLLGPG